MITAEKLSWIKVCMQCEPLYYHSVHYIVPHFTTSILVKLKYDFLKQLTLLSKYLLFLLLSLLLPLHQSSNSIESMASTEKGIWSIIPC